MMLRVRHGKTAKRHHRKRRKNEGLNKADKEFQPEERDRYGVRNEERHDSKEYLASEDVAEQPE